MRVLLANPRGFCAGVDRAIEIVERALDLFGAPIYVRHEVVHNRFVVDRLAGLGAMFVVWPKLWSYYAFLATLGRDAQAPARPADIRRRGAA